jgi:hypothetical protein
LFLDVVMCHWLVPERGRSQTHKEHPRIPAACCHFEERFSR